jgi:hypothetical protein
MTALIGRCFAFARRIAACMRIDELGQEGDEASPPEAAESFGGSQAISVR